MVFLKKVEDKILSFFLSFGVKKRKLECTKVFFSANIVKWRPNWRTEQPRLLSLLRRRQRIFREPTTTRPFFGLELHNNSRDLLAFKECWSSSQACGFISHTQTKSQPFFSATPPDFLLCKHWKFWQENRCSIANRIHGRLAASERKCRSSSIKNSLFPILLLIVLAIIC